MDSLIGQEFRYALESRLPHDLSTVRLQRGTPTVRPLSRRVGGFVCFPYLFSGAGPLRAFLTLLFTQRTRVRLFVTSV